MSFQLARITFSDTKDQFPDRYSKADLAATSIQTEKPGEYLVQRGGSDNAHPCSLVQAAGECYGHCTCDGYGYNDGACSHLCALWRAHKRGLIDLPRGRIETATVSILDRQQELADARDDGSRHVAPDGGGRHGRDL